MNKNTKLEERMKEDQIASIGIGAMIVFIALILVAAVASAVIIQTGEKLQQNAQQTGSDTQEEIGGKINIITVWVGDQSDCDGDGDADTDTDEEVDVCITLVYELAAGSEQMTEDQFTGQSLVWMTLMRLSCSTEIWGTFDGFYNAKAYAAILISQQINESDTVNVMVTKIKVMIEWFDAGDDDEDTLNPGQVYMISLKT